MAPGKPNPSPPAPPMWVTYLVANHPILPTQCSQRAPSALYLLSAYDDDNTQALVTVEAARFLQTPMHGGSAAVLGEMEISLWEERSMSYKFRKCVSKGLHV